MDSLQQVLMTHCAQEPDFLNDHTTLVDGVFRVLLSHGNAPADIRRAGGKIGQIAGYNSENDRKRTGIQRDQTDTRIIHSARGLIDIYSMYCPCSSMDRAAAF